MTSQQFPHPAHQMQQHGAAPAPHAHTYNPYAEARSFPATPMPAAKRSIFTPYVLLWSVSGFLAIGYIAVMGLAPQLIDDMTPTSAFISEPQSNQGQRAAARLVADVNGLKESMAQVQLELAKVKTDVEITGGREKALNAQLAALEQRLGLAQGRTLETAEPAGTANANPPGEAAATEVQAPAQTTGQPPAQPPAEIQAEGPPAVPAQPSAPKARTAVAAPPAQAKIVNADANATLNWETASVGDGLRAAKPGKTTPAAKTKATAAAAAGTVPGTDIAEASTSGAITDPIVFSEPAVQPAAAPVGVQISSGASVDSLRLSWSLLADRHADALKNLEARYVAHGEAGNPTYDLIAGPIRSRSEALKVCKALAAKGVPCKVNDFLGAAL